MKSVVENIDIAPPRSLTHTRKWIVTISSLSDFIYSILKTGEIIASLASKTDQIGEITQVINDIADQTNLLALNAAIAAA